MKTKLLYIFKAIKTIANFMLMSKNEVKTFYDAFHRVFKVVKATTDQQKKEAYQLRYEVFCEEVGFEDSKAFEDHCENDAYDKHSDHYLIIHIPTEENIGTVRIILPDPIDLDHSFPIQELCDNRELHDVKKVINAFEVSRFCASKKRRSDLKEFANHIPDVPEPFVNREQTKQMLPYITLALMNAAVQAGADHMLSDCYFVVEKSLKSKLLVLGARLDKVNDAVEFHGTRYPLHIDIKHGLDTITKVNPAAWDVITNHGEYIDIINKQPE